MNRTLHYYHFSPETQYLDRKSARKKPQELLKHLIAFANADGGQLVIGIEDDKQNNIITGFKDGRAYPIDEFKRLTVRCVTLPWIYLLKKSLCETIRVKTM